MVNLYAKNRNNSYNSILRIIILLLLFSLNSITTHSQESINDYVILDHFTRESNELLEHSASYYNTEAFKYIEQDSFLLALEYAILAEKKAIIENDFNSLTTQYIVQGHVYLNYGAYVKAIDNFSKSEKLSKEHNLKKILINAKYGLGLTYNSLNKFDIALQILNEGLIVAKKSNDPRDQAIILNAIGRAYQGKLEIDSSLIYLEKYLNISKEIEDSLYITYALINIGESYRLQGDSSLAISYYKTAEQWNSTISNIQAMAAIFGNLAIIHTSNRNYVKANAYYKKSIELSSNHRGLSSYLLLDLKSIAKNFGMIQQFDSAHLYFQKYLTVSDSVMLSDHQDKLSTLYYSQQLLQKENDAQIIKQKLFVRSLIIAFITLISLLIIILMIVNHSRNKLKSQKIEEEMKLLNLRIDKKNRELITKILDNKIHSEVREEVNSIISSIEEEGMTNHSLDRLIDIESRLKTIEIANLAWNSFKLHFEQVHPDFFENLMKVTSQLTTNDIRFCAYMKLRLSTKEIAQISNISHKSARATNLRLQKKVKVTNNDELQYFIDNL